MNAYAPSDRRAHEFHNIPQELRALNQWVAWKYETRNGSAKPTKVPYNPRTGQHASVKNAATWVSFDEAVSAANSEVGYDGIGFVFSNDDPYCGIDMDAADGEMLERQHAIYRHINSYSELSVSGRGLHIIAKATVPDGRRRDSIEIYSSDRYFTFTGWVYGDQQTIEDRQIQVDEVWAEMGARFEAADVFGDAEQLVSDDEVYNKAANAANGAKFLQLCFGVEY